MTNLTRSIAPALAGLLACNAGALAQDLVEESAWTESFEVLAPDPRITVSNVWGSVLIKAGAAGQIILSVHERRSAPDASLLELSREIITLNTRVEAQDISMVVGDPERRWQRFDRCPGCRVDYQLELTVPAAAVVEVSTVTDGKVTVEGISGLVTASNVNGPVRVIGAENCKSLNSVNGEVSISFAGRPAGDCHFETINGDIALTLPAGVGFDAAVNLVNGKILSDFDVSSIAIPAKVEQTTEDGRYRYRIEQPAGVRVLGGGPTFSFSSLNGDIQIRGQ